MTEATAPFTGHLQPGERPALLLVDLVRAYFDPAFALHLGDDSSLRSASRLLAAARGAGVPVVHTRVQYSPGGADGGTFFRKVPALAQLVGESEAGCTCDEVAPADGEVVVTKQYASAFFGTTLASTLTAMRVDTLVIAGVSTSGCVRATAVDACQHGFVPLVVRDACGDRRVPEGPDPHEANLRDLQAKYAEVVDEATAVRYLAERG